MIFTTPHGDFNQYDLDNHDVSRDARLFVDSVQLTGQLFFCDKIDITSEVYKDSEYIVQELVEVLLVDEEFSEPEKGWALAEETKNKLPDIRESSEGYHIGDELYYVFTDEEADKRHTSRLTEDLKESFDSFSDYNVAYIAKNFVPVEWFNERRAESNHSYVTDIKEESSTDSDVYVNRLHEEMVDNHILDEPDWPIHEFEREEFPNHYLEPQLENFDDDDDDDGESFSIAHEQWSNELDTWEDEQNELELSAQSDYEYEKDAYTDKLNDEIDEKISEFIENMVDGDVNGVNYWIDSYGIPDFHKTLIEYDLLAMDDAIEWLSTEEERSEISTYDGVETEVNITYKHEQYTFYIYRID